MRIMNYLQSFLPNGLVNANGSITTWGLYGKMFKWDFASGKWEQAQSSIQLDSNGVANGIYKWRNSTDYEHQAQVRDADGNLLRGIALPEWDDSAHELLLEETREAISEAGKLSQYAKVYITPAEPSKDISGLRGYVMVINTISATPGGGMVIMKVRGHDGPVDAVIKKGSLMMLFNNDEGWSVML